MWYKISFQNDVSISQILEEKGVDINTLSQEDINDLIEEISDGSVNIRQKNGDVIVSPNKNFENLYNINKKITETIDRFFTDRKFLNRDISKDFTGGIGTQY